MARMSWKNPPPVVAIGGSEDFLVKREIQNAVNTASRAGISVERAETEMEINSAFGFADTFGAPTMVVIRPPHKKKVPELSAELVQQVQQAKRKRSCLLVMTLQPFDAKKTPWIEAVPEGYRVLHNRATKAKDLRTNATRFAMFEADRVMGQKKSLDKKLAEALVGKVGTDLGLVAFEILKAGSLARAQGSPTIGVVHVKETLNPSGGMDLAGLRDALKIRNPYRVGRALLQIRTVGQRDGRDPVMLLLRARGGPADLCLTWLQAKLLQEQGVHVNEIGGRMGMPRWLFEKDVLPALNRWSVPQLRAVVSDLAAVEQGIFDGAPAPWVSCEAALLRACSS